VKSQAHLDDYDVRIQHLPPSIHLSVCHLSPETKSN